MSIKPFDKFFESSDQDQLDLIQDIFTDLSDEARVSTFFLVKNGIHFGEGKRINIFGPHNLKNFNGYGVFISFEYKSRKEIATHFQSIKDIEKRLNMEDLIISPLSIMRFGTSSVTLNRMDDVISGVIRIHRELSTGKNLYGFILYIKSQ